MGSRRAEHEKRASTGSRRAACSPISQRCSSTAPDNGWRCLPIKNCAVNFPISSAARPNLGTQKVLRYMTPISEAVILMAGEGSRLRGFDKTLLKPFVPVLGRPLICYTIDALIHAGIGKVSFIVDYQSDRMTMGIKQLIPSGLEAVFIPNWEWRKQNGISVLAAANHITSPFLLTMSDHLFEQSILDLLLHNPALDELNLAIDRKVDSIFDSDDAMRSEERRVGEECR